MFGIRLGVVPAFVGINSQVYDSLKMLISFASQSF